MADTTVKIFSSAQLGAPTLANVAGNLISVLDACLVDGFGLKTCDSVVIASGVGTATISTGHGALEQGVVTFAGATGSHTALNGERKVTSVSTNVCVFDATGLPDGTVSGTITMKLSAAGWTKAFSGTNLAAYKSSNVQASGSFLRVQDTTTTIATVRGYEAMTDINTGTGIFPTTAQSANSYWPKSNSAAAKPWWIIANDRFVYFGVAFNSGYVDNYAIYGFGDMVPRRTGDPYRAILLSVSSDPTGSYPNSNVSPIGPAVVSSNLRYAPRSYTGLGSPVALTPAWLSLGSSTSGFGGATFPNPADNGVIFTPMLMTEGSGYRGELPGCFATPQSIQTGILDGQIINNVPGFARAVQYRQWMVGNNPSIGGVFFDITGPWSS